MTLLQVINSDYKKHKKYGSHFFVILFFTQGFWAIFQYRIAHYLYMNIKWKIFRLPLMGVTLIWQKMIEILTGISIASSAKIGHSFYIGHFGNSIINANAIIGNNCNISQGVTIGVSGYGERRGVPEIGNNVYIGANTVVAGKITIGNSVLIGACSLVKDSFGDNAVLMGVPAVVISYKGSKDYI